MNDFIINDGNFRQFTQPQLDGYHRGYVPRDFGKVPLGSYSGGEPFQELMPLIPREEWPERCADGVAQESQLSNFQTWDVLDQGSHGFCWAYSVTACVMLARAAMGLPYVRLSPHAVACKIYGFQDRGAWGAVAFDFIHKNGVPSDELWPQKSMNRSNDNAATWKDAFKYRITEGFIDLSPPHPADADMTFDEVATCLLGRIPVVGDFNWWGHSVALADLVDLRPQDGQQGLSNPDRWGVRGPNSWTKNWGNNGWFVLQGRKAIPDGGCAPRMVTVV